MNGSAFDLFSSYSRRDNELGRVTQLVERIQSDFAVIAGRELRPFFDVHEIHGMDDLALYSNKGGGNCLTHVGTEGATTFVFYHFVRPIRESLPPAWISPTIVMQRDAMELAVSYT